MSTANTEGVPDEAIAVIGMAGRFPHAPDTDAFWADLLAGHDSVTAAVGPGGGSRGVLEGHDLFDADFFGFSPLEAEITDPQHRLFLETAWHAVDHAGYGAAAGRPVTGLFGGSSTSRYLIDVLASPRHRDVLDDSQLLIGCDKDYLATRTAHRMDLRGPAVTVQTACSTSLVAVHMACQAVLSGECDMALAGGVAVRPGGGLGGTSERTDGMVSPLGRCRAFDASATGMVSGDGVAVVVLRRVEDALRDGDRIHALIRGSAVNNDGSVKAGYTAPGVGGQASAIRSAHAVAGTRPSEIGFVEAHGTGTRLGDPIEVAALAEVFGEGRGPRTCVLGSVKTNIGHLDAAAGVTSLIKAVLAVREGVIPPTLHFERPNPDLRLDETPFRVTTEPVVWTESEGPRRAGVSSFGIGGTNAHVIVEQPPEQRPSDPGHGWQVVPVSARTAAARDTAYDTVRQSLAEIGSEALADAAFTLQTGREEFEYRAAVVLPAGRGFASGRAHGPVTGRASAPVPPAFLFPGQGSQYPGMARGLYDREPLFRAELDSVLEAVRAAYGPDLASVLGLTGVGEPGPMNRTDLTQPALFAVEYALARLWTAWGVTPGVLLGHSLGELVAACVAGVMSLEDAARLVVARGAAMAACASGAMTAVGLGEHDLSGRLPEQVEVAAVNTRSQTVVCGPEEAVEAFERDLDARGVRHSRLVTDRAFHSAAMLPAVAEVTRVARTLGLSAPRIPVVSNVTGGPLSDDEATDPAYWGRQLREPVRFADGVEHLAGTGTGLAVEVGPGAVLRGMLAERGGGARIEALGSLPGTGLERDETEFVRSSLAGLWVRGATVDWSALHEPGSRLRVPLPGYPFESRPYSVEPGSGTERVPLVAPRVEGEGERPVADSPKTEDADARPEMSDTERLIAQVWERRLGVSRIERDVSFFDLGGNSLIGIHVLDELSRVFGVDLPKSAVYETPTVESLGLAVEEALVASLELGADEETPHGTEVSR